MKFYCHTNYGARIEVDAKNPEDARKQVKAVHPTAQITKVKVVRKQPNTHRNEDHA